ncbi:hypothetical protein KJ785_04260 [Patescibacteria group bacterium]|nr:hypothetical protein [Patescibacteria group bacterium]
MILKSIKNKKIEIIIVSLIFIASFLPFLMNLSNQFVSDDWNFLDLVAMSDRPLLDNFSLNTYGEQAGGTYRPIVNIFWVLNYRIWGLNSFGFHITNLFFHGLNAILIFLLVSKSKLFGSSYNKRRWVAIASSIIFIVLPSHAVAGSWISVANDTMMTTFVLLSWYLLLKTEKSKNWLLYFRQRRTSSLIPRSFLRRVFIHIPIIYCGVVYLFSIFFFVLAIFTKEMALAVPFIMVAWSILAKRLAGFKWLEIFKSLIFLLPYFFTIGLYVLARFWVTGMMLSDYTHGSLGVTKNMFWRSVTGHFTSLFLSGEQRNAVLYQLFNYPLKFGIIIVVILIFLAIISIKKKVGGVKWLLSASFLFSLIPVTQFTANYTAHYFSAEGDRLSYFSSLFVAVLVGLFFRDLYYYCSGRCYLKIISICLFLSLLASLFFQLVNKNLHWHQAARVADTLISDWDQVTEGTDWNGFVLLGVPDNYHGAFIFRNGLDSALKIKHNLNKDNLIITENRTLFYPGGEFEMDRETKNDFIYRQRITEEGSLNPNLIASSPEITSFDYNSNLEDFYKEIFSIAYSEFGKTLNFYLTDDFVSDNINNRIGILFFNGQSWSLLTL